MDITAKQKKTIKLFEKVPVVGETTFSLNHRQPLLRPNGVDRWIMNLTVSGTGIINRTSNEFRVARGTLLLFPPGVIHDYTKAPEEDWIHMWCYFDCRTDWQTLLEWPECGRGVMMLKSDSKDMTDRLESVFRKLLNIYNNFSGKRKEQFCYNVLEELLLWTDTLNTLSENNYNRKVNNCLAYIRKNLHRKLSISVLAAQSHMSPSRFAHWFKEVEGIAPIRYIERLRMEKARELLGFTNNDIGSIAEACGYSDQLHFSRIFKKQTGTSPRNFRKIFLS